LWTYCKGPMTFEAAADLMNIIARLYWLTERENRPRLSRLHELVLVAKALQGLTWDELADITKKSPKSLQEMGHEIACIYFEYLTGVDPEKHVPGVKSSEYNFQPLKIDPSLTYG